ncbi:MAG TPA: GUN4 domain-containing protein [Trichormus sp. M33_DOE_039]|nr:GUN4 domain-containing protein [Trichormus sp. M33_DOE_039]
MVSRNWHTQDEAFADVARGIRAAVEKLKQEREKRQRELEEDKRRQQETEKAFTKAGIRTSVEILKQKQEELQPQQETEKLDQNELASDKSVDYRRLRDLLAAKKWQEADYETYLVMLQVVGRERGDYIRTEELLNFPCTDLRTVDRLWVKYSKGHFGFRVQKEIYLSVGGMPDGNYYSGAWEKFCDRVGWTVKSRRISYEDLTFDTSSPKGHLPWTWGSVLQILNFLLVLPLLSHRDL